MELRKKPVENEPAALKMQLEVRKKAPVFQIQPNRLILRPLGDSRQMRARR
jgi:hypothetical protein